jgi:AmpD protein
VPFREFTQLSPNRDLTPPNEQLGVVFHHSVISFDETIAFMMLPASKASYHVLIDLDGTRCTFVPDEQIAWHAGASTFLGRTRCNDFTLGASFAGDTNLAPLTDAQIASTLEWLAPRWTQHGWTPACVTDHRQVSPGRKDDLNPAEWSRLLAAITGKF